MNLNVKVNEKIKLECVDLNHQGLGVCKIDGYPIFVNNLLVGEVANVVITKLNKSFGYGEVEEILEYSESRATPRSSAYDSCGGCNIMHMNYQAQLDHKVKMANETFKRLGHLDNVTVDKIIGMENPYFYRNKVQIPFRMENKKVICGFYKKQTHDIIPLEECFIQSTEATELAKLIKDLANDLKIPAYDETTKKGVLRHVLIRNTSLDEYMVVLITNTDVLPHHKVIINKIIEKYPNVKSIIQNINKKGTNIILGTKSRLLYGNSTIIERLMGLNFYVSHQSFFQTNHSQTEKLYQQVLTYVDPLQTDVIIDGYCGVGTITLFLAQSCKKVYGIEIVEEAIRDAKKNAKLNEIKNVEFITGKTEEEIVKITETKIDTIVVDPPRKGCDKKLLETIIAKKIKKIVYVSCNVATLARDLEILTTDYDVKGVTLVDMFPHISDVETCVLLSLK